VQEAVEMAEALADLVGHCGDLALVVGVHLQDVGRRGEAAGAHLGELHPLAEPRQQDLRPLLLGEAGHGEGDALRGEHAGDQELAAIKEHRRILPEPRLASSWTL